MRSSVLAVVLRARVVAATCGMIPDVVLLRLALEKFDAEVDATLASAHGADRARLSTGPVVSLLEQAELAAKARDVVAGRER